MGQRHALVLFLAGGGLMFPLVVLALLPHLLGVAAVPTVFGLLLVGFACLVGAKWPVLRQSHFFSFGPGGLSLRRRKLYFFGYALLSAGMLLALFTQLELGALR